MIVPFIGWRRREPIVSIGLQWHRRSVHVDQARFGLLDLRSDLDDILTGEIPVASRAWIGE